MATLIDMNTATQTVSSGATSSRKPKITPTEILFICLGKWYWFVISIIICGAIGWIHIQKTAPTYKKSAAVLIKTDSDGKSMSANEAIFSDLGIARSGSFLLDEIQIIQSPDLMRDVVRKLKLNTQYFVEDTFRDKLVYGNELPVSVEFLDLTEDDSASFTIILGSNGEYTIKDLTLRGKDMNRPEMKGIIGTPLKTALGRIEVIPGKAYETSPIKEMRVSHSTVKGMAGSMMGRLKADTDKKSFNMVVMDYIDINPQRAEDILGQIIASYNDRWMSDKRTLADNSSKFIDERVALLQKELGSVDDDISSFKSANLIPDVDAAASLYMSQATQTSMALKDLRNQEYMAKYIRNYLRNTENNNKLLPANAGLANASISGQIAQYNTKILERNSLVSQSSTSNPLVAEMDQALAAMRSALMSSIDNEILSLGEQIRSQEGFNGTATSKIASNPKQAKYLLSVERQQKVKETLYLYLLQKREENQLQQALTSYNTRIVREPDGSNGPISPNKGIIYAISLALGVAIPAFILLLQELTTSVVRGRQDIKDLKAPFAGELPLYGKHQSLKRRRGEKENPTLVAVKENNRNSINEAFRMVRTNIEFMYGNDGTSKVVMLTAANVGSGKTFVSYNLSKSFAIKGKRVVAIDLDMRKATLSKYIDSPAKGISDYLANQITDISAIIHDVEDCPNMSVIPVGTIPPNPTELLYSERFHALIEDLKLHNDYIFFDCPPIEVVADSTIISQYAQYTIFVIRAGVLRLSLLPSINEIYEKGKFPNMSIVLNGTLNPSNSYARRYGNPYTYGYGYGTTYTYGD